MSNQVAPERRKAPEFNHWESPETRIRWERGLAIIAGMVGVVVVFFMLLSILPLSGDEEDTAITGAAAPGATAAAGAAPAQAQAQPPAAAAAGLSPTAAATPAGAGNEPKLAATSRAAPNVRRAPSLEGERVSNLSPGQKVDVVGHSADNQWLQILNPANPRERLWVSADMLDVTGDPRTLPEAR